MTEGDVTAEPLSYLSDEARKTICRLNSEKLIPSDGPGNLPRDYRGLANCIQISSQDIDSSHPNKTDWLLQTWICRNDGTANIHTLLLYLERIDRRDIKDDLLALGTSRRLITGERSRIQTQESVPDRSLVQKEMDDLVTIEDMVRGEPVIYDALVLHAADDLAFVQEMMEKMNRDYGYQLVTKDSLRPGMGLYSSIPELIKNRCRFVILVYSPAFFRSPDERFFMDFVHSWNINSNQRRLLPCMYIPCKLPEHYSFYHNLHYNSAAYNFWDHLGRFLTPRPVPRVPALQLPQSTVDIQELHNKSLSNGNVSNGHQVAYETHEPSTRTITLPSVPSDRLSSASTESLDRPFETASLNDISRIKKKNKSIASLFRRPFKIFSKNKNSKKILVSN